MKTPTPEEITRVRNNARITQTAAAALIHSNLRTWQAWEGGTNKMHPGLWELFTQKVKQHA